MSNITVPPNSEPKAPRLYIGTFSNAILCAPKWKQRKDGLQEATGQTYDVTQNALDVVLKYLEENDVTVTEKDGKRYRLVVTREPVESESLA